MWLATTLPEEISWLTRPGFASAFMPMSKNVAGTPYLARTARICGVHVGSGPSSKVRATRPARRDVLDPAGQGPVDHHTVERQGRRDRGERRGRRQLPDGRALEVEPQRDPDDRGDAAVVRPPQDGAVAQRRRPAVGRGVPQRGDVGRGRGRDGCGRGEGRPERRGRGSPGVAVGGRADLQLVGGDDAQRGRHGGLDPGRRSDRPGAARRVVLVVGHELDDVDERGQCREVVAERGGVVRLGDRHGDREAAGGREVRPQSREQVEQPGLVGPCDLLEVDDDPVPAVAVARRRRSRRRRPIGWRGLARAAPASAGRSRRPGRGWGRSSARRAARGRRRGGRGRARSARGRTGTCRRGSRARRSRRSC